MHEKGTIVGGFGERAPGGLRGGSIGGGYHLPPPADSARVPSNATLSPAQTCATLSSPWAALTLWTPGTAKTRSTAKTAATSSAAETITTLTTAVTAKMCLRSSYSTNRVPQRVAT